MICHNAQIIGGFHDESTFANILARRDTDACPMVDGLSITKVSFNGQLRTLHAIVIDGSNGRFAARDVLIDGCKATAHLGRPYIVSGADNGKCIVNTLRGYSSAYKTNGDAANCAGVLIFGVTRDFHCEGNTYGGGINEYEGAEIIAPRFGRYDITLSQPEQHLPQREAVLPGQARLECGYAQPSAGHAQHRRHRGMSDEYDHDL